MTDERDPKRQRMGGSSAERPFDLTGPPPGLTPSTASQASNERDINPHRNQDGQATAANHHPAEVYHYLHRDPDEILPKIRRSITAVTEPSPKDKAYLVQVRLILPGAKMAPSRILCVPAAANFNHLGKALVCAMGWSGMHLWKFHLQRHVKPLAKDARQNGRLIVAEISDHKDIYDIYGDETTLEAKRTRLLDLWGKHQTPAVREADLFLSYDFGSRWCHRVSFLGVAEEGLTADDVELKVRKGQMIWYLSGRGVPWLEDASGEDEFEMWEEETNMHEWDIEVVDKGLAKIKVEGL